MNLRRSPLQNLRKRTARRTNRRTRAAAAPQTPSGNARNTAGKAAKNGTCDLTNGPSRGPTASQRLRKYCYRMETLRPIVCLWFIAPLLLFYEIGSIFLDNPAGKSGIDQWMHRMLESIGFGQLVVLPILTAAILISWHHRVNDVWKLRPSVLAGMALESLGLGMILFFAANAIHQMFHGDAASVMLAINLDQSGLNWWSNTISYLGCGVYEELVFRLIMLNGLILAMNRFWGLERAGRIVGMLATSLLFAAMHYNFFNPAGAEFDGGSFLFRTLASVVFCVLFLFRGFGIAVGTHAIYDVLTQI